MIIDEKEFWAWRRALTTDAAKRPLARANRPWPELIKAPFSIDERQKYFSKLVQA